MQILMHDCSQNLWLFENKMGSWRGQKRWRPRHIRAHPLAGRAIGAAANRAESDGMDLAWESEAALNPMQDPFHFSRSAR
ncbi:hypothetical protein [Achromobacter insolitus]|uniref:hypothetical protein n=1 Tax=Achromobacter insolitus TaxID=217204 RepID=UPI001EED2841|nr:hypothetical protein [Achromobacter insolitus]